MTTWSWRRSRPLASVGVLATGVLAMTLLWQPRPAAAEPRSISVRSNQAEIADGVRDVAYSAASDTLWATVGTGDPVTDAALLAIRPSDLTTSMSYPAPVPRPPSGQPVRSQELDAVAVDDRHGRIWSTSPSQHGYAAFNDQRSWSYRAGGFPSPRDVLVDDLGDRAYLSVTGALAVISTAGYTSELPAIPLGDGAQPTTLALVGSGAQAKVITVDETTGELLVIAPADRTVRRLAGVAGATTVAVTPGGERAYLAGPGLPQIAVIDLVAGEQTAAIPLASGAGALAYDGANQLLYATQPGASALAIVDLAANQVASTVQLSGMPKQVLFAKGALFVPLSTPVTTADTLTALYVSTTPPADPDPTDDAGVEVGVTIAGAGGLTLGFDSTSVDLGSARLDDDLDHYTASGVLPRVTVLDNRSTDPGWSLVGQVTAFRSDTGAASEADLGWRPRVVSADSGQAVSAGPEVVPRAGLATPRVLAEGRPGLGAELGFTAPSSIDPGSYRAVLTLTLA